MKVAFILLALCAEPCQDGDCEVPKTQMQVAPLPGGWAAVAPAPVPVVPVVPSVAPVYTPCYVVPSPVMVARPRYGLFGRFRGWDCYWR